MYSFRPPAIPTLAVALVGLLPGGAAQDITAPERAQAQALLVDSRARLQEAVAGLTPAQWNFKPNPTRWSIAEVLEHLAVTETMIDGVLNSLFLDPAPPAGRDPSALDSAILTRVPDRSTKAQAPEPIRPTGRWSPAETLHRFLDARAETLALLASNNDLRGHLFAHPAFGPCDGYQWILLAATHTTRHTAQILEVKAGPNFPASAH